MGAGLMLVGLHGSFGSKGRTRMLLACEGSQQTHVACWFAERGALVRLVSSLWKVSAVTASLPGQGTGKVSRG